MRDTRRRRSSLRATLALALGVLSLLVAVVSLIIARVTLSELRRLKAETQAAKVSDASLKKLWAKRSQGPTAERDAPASRPWYGLCPINGARSVAAFRASVDRSPLLSRQYAAFQWEKARLVTLDRPQRVYVNYVKSGRVGWTRNPLSLARGEAVITDGATTVRAYCCNEITDAPASPTMVDEPVTALLQPPEERSAGPVPPPEEIWDSPAKPGDTNTPEPGTWLLVGTGAVALLGAGARRPKYSRGGE